MGDSSGRTPAAGASSSDIQPPDHGPGAQLIDALPKTAEHAAAAPSGPTVPLDGPAPECLPEDPDCLPAAPPPLPAAPPESAPPTVPPRRVSGREIWEMTWPQALMMLCQFLVGFTDVTVAGHINSLTQGALGIIAQCQFFLMVIGIALVNGGMAVMSQSLGARLPLRAARYVGLLLELSAACCLATMAVAWFFRVPLFHGLGVRPELFPLTLDLWELYLYILPGSFLSFTTMAVFRARKNVLVPLAAAVVVCVLNFLGDLGFGLGWFGLPAFGARGLVYASIFSVLAGGLFNLAVLLRKGLLTRESFPPWRWARRALPYILKVALPAGGSQFLWQFGYMVFFLIINTLPSGGASDIAGLVAGMRIESVLFLPAMAFSFTGSVLVGHCLGAGNHAEAKRVGLRIAILGASSMSVVALCLWPFLDAITAFVAPDPAVREVARAYLVFNLLAAPFTVSGMILLGIFSGAGATFYNLLVFCLSTWLVRLPLAWLMGHYLWMSPSGVFLSMLVSQVVQSLTSLYIFLRWDWYRFSSTAKRYARKRT